MSLGFVMYSTHLIEVALGRVGPGEEGIEQAQIGLQQGVSKL
jgi:hypothetical protein